MTGRDKVRMRNTDENREMIICDEWGSFNGVIETKLI